MSTSNVVHWLKVWPQYFDALLYGRKSFEFRKDDRTPRYEVGDTLVLREWRPSEPEDADFTYLGDGHYTGRVYTCRATYVARGGVIPKGYCCMAIVPTGYPVPASETPAGDGE